MNIKKYNIYIIKEEFDRDIGVLVERWSLGGKFKCRARALHKARIMALLNQYQRVEVVCSQLKSCGQIKNRLIWAHDKQQSTLIMRLQQKTKALSRRLSRTSDSI